MSPIVSLLRRQRRSLSSASSAEAVGEHECQSDRGAAFSAGRRRLSSRVGARWNRRSRPDPGWWERGPQVAGNSSGRVRGGTETATFRVPGRDRPRPAAPCRGGRAPPPTPRPVPGPRVGALARGLPPAPGRSHPAARRPRPGEPALPRLTSIETPFLPRPGRRASTPPATYPPPGPPDLPPPSGFRIADPSARLLQ